jgi:hypothetical protein
MPWPPFWLTGRMLALALWAWASCAVLALAESPAPSVHWGAIAYPDKDRTLTAGLTVNRFTEFDAAGHRYNDIRETSGFNFASLSWTERLAQLNGWNTNLTVGAGPTQDGLTRFLQNDVVHKVRGLTPVPVGAKRHATDFMIGGSLTRWKEIFSRQEDAFAGVGAASGSLYHELYTQIGVRRVSLPDSVPYSRFVRFSAMGRYGRLFGGSAFPIVAPQSYLGQASVAVGNYQPEKGDRPSWEIEVAMTIDSGLFVDGKGDSIEERFVSAAFRYSFVSFETWNDFVNQKDYGPTFGARLTVDLLQIYHAWRDRS